MAIIQSNTTTPYTLYDSRGQVIGSNRQQAQVKNLSNYIAPIQLQRLRQDVTSWRYSIAEAERAFYPHRVKMQQMFIDTILNGHVFSVMERRKDLTLLRDFKMCDAKGEADEDLTNFFKKDWFELLVEYSLDALFFGYSLISLGDIISDGFPDLDIIRRWNISPDRNTVNSFIYSPSGQPFLEEPYSDWHIWVKTANNTGVSKCGMGLFYQIGLYEIFLRNTLGFNGDFVELYSQPYRVGKTTKTDDDERAELEAALQNMGSSGYAIIDPTDDIQFIETQLGGTGWKGYENLEQRCEKKVSAIILGHEDAVKSVPGKLGSQQGGKDDSPVGAALADKQSKDGKFIENVVNKQLLPKMRNLGFNIPETHHFEYKNDAEVEEFRKKEDESNLQTATLFKMIHDAGGKPDWKYFSDRTRIQTEEMPPPPAPVNPLLEKGKPKLDPAVKNRLEKLYK